MLWVKAFHVVFVVAWFAGVFYLPRLFVNHAMTAPGEDAVVARLRVMEAKLFRFTTMNAVLATGFALWLAFGWWREAFAGAHWLHAKLVLVVVLFGYHAWCGVTVKALAAGPPRHTHRYYRWLNELPVLLLVAIVILVVVKPF